MKKNNSIIAEPLRLKEIWVIRVLVVMVVILALMWGVSADSLKYERQKTQQLRLKLQQEQGRMQPAL